MKRIVIVAILVLAALAVYGQSNEFVDGLIGSKSVTFGQVSYLVLVSSDNISEDADSARAFELLSNMGWAPARAKVDTPIRLDEYALILSKAFGLKGSIMMGILPSPHSAYHNLAALQVIQGRTDPGMEVSGIQAVQMLGRVFDVLGLNK